MNEKVLNTTCGYCSTGCNLSVYLANDKVVQVKANPVYPVNLGKACPKGFQFLGHLVAANRATRPYVRDSQGNLQPVNWDKALEIFTDGFRRIKNQYGSESVAFLSTGQITNEEFAYLGALAKFGMGFIHGDGNTRQCMASAVVAYKQSFGFDAPPFTYKDFEESDVLVFFGSNPAIAHPVMWNRVKMNTKQPRIIVVDPRKTETAGNSGVEHYGLLPKSDLVLLFGLANLLIAKDWINNEYIEQNTVGFNSFKAHVQDFTLARVSAITGLSADQIVRLAETIHSGDRVSFWWMVGINQGYQAVRTAQAIINLALLTGNIGRPGTGANSITGQCNAMGSRLFSNTSSLFCGRDFTNLEHRQEVAQILNLNAGLIPTKASFTYDRILEGVDRGQIKGLWIICTNPVHSWVDRNKLLPILKKAEFIVVQDMFLDTDTAQLANLILPASGCGEKDGTFINSERRIGRLRKIMEPPGDALPDFKIFQRVAHAWGCEDLFQEWNTTEEVFQILKRLSAGTPCDFSSVRDYAMIEESGGIQWPFTPNTVVNKERRLFADGLFFYPDGKARFIFENIVEPPEMPNQEYPYILITGRGSIAQWHTLTRTDKAPILKKMSPDPNYVEINQQDAAKLGIVSGEPVLVSSKRGESRARAKISANIQPGQIFMPMHYAQTNNLTLASFDPYSRQPSFKHAAVKITRLSQGQNPDQI
jgi:predicted molibdopterin-dependent oxidoreductase YjgC